MKSGQYGDENNESAYAWRSDHPFDVFGHVHSVGSAKDPAQGKQAGRLQRLDIRSPAQRPGTRETSMIDAKTDYWSFQTRNPERVSATSLSTTPFREPAVSTSKGGRPFVRR